MYLTRGYAPPNNNKNKTPHPDQIPGGNGDKTHADTGTATADARPGQRPSDRVRRGENTGRGHPRRERERERNAEETGRGSSKKPQDPDRRTDGS